MALKNKKGFTLIELLVVIAIIGILSTLSVIALNSARARARDAKRISDIGQIQTALEMYYSSNNEYPAATSSLVTDKLLLVFPVAPTPSDGTCLANNSYVYSRASQGTYTLKYCLGSGTGNLKAGAQTASSGSIGDQLQ